MGILDTPATAVVRGLAASLACALVIGLGGAASAPAAAEPFVAGVAPDRRPDGAPRQTTPAKIADAAQTAGIATPLPPLAFIKDHGGWYTPFTRPGMPGPYDIRGLHAGGASARPPATAAPAASGTTKKP